jgi:hypothetical protein
LYAVEAGSATTWRRAGVELAQHRAVDDFVADLDADAADDCWVDDDLEVDGLP